MLRAYQTVLLQTLGHGEVHTIKTAYQGTGPHNFQSVGFGVRTNFDDSKKILNFEKYVNIIA